MGQNGGWRAARILPLLLLVPVGGVLGWQVVKSAAVGELTRRNPAAAAMFAPRDPAPRIGAAMLEFRLRQGEVSPATRQAALAALPDEPLADEPFLLAGIDAVAKGQTARGETLLTEARRRNPRSRITRLVLLDRYIRTGRTADATLEISALNRLMPRASELLVPELAKMVSRKEQRATVTRVLLQDPELFNAVLAHLAKNNADPDLVLELAAAQPRSNVAVQRDWQALLVDQLVKRGDPGRALQMWQSFGGQPRAAGNGVYDGSFQGKPGLPPFNWAFFANPGGIAERSRGGGLDVIYYGRDRSELAKQLLTLAPGRYRIRFGAEGGSSGEGGNVAWQLKCEANKNSVLDMPISNVTSTPRTYSAEFTVPGGCAAQWLTLAGVPGEYPTEQTITLRDLVIERSGS